MTDHVTVGVRVRPLNQLEISSSTPHPAWRASSPTSSIYQIASPHHPTSSTTVRHDFKFDAVFDEASSNAEVYTQLCAPLVTAAVSGYNATLLAYGQTCSGKTHSMLGSTSDAGLTPLAIRDVFRQLSSNALPVTSVSYIEIYNDKLRDLLNPSSDKQLTIRDKNASSVSVLGATVVPVSTAQDALRLLHAGQLIRQTADTAMNARSSRSHTLFILHFSAGNSLNLVDLAGSERAKGTHATGTRLKEGAAINQSLLVLGTIISKLSTYDTNGNEKKPKKNGTGHLPFRDSKLTRMLRPSFGGDSKTAVLCTITPAAVFFDESLSTLKFATRASGVVNGAVLKRRKTMVDYKIKYREVEIEVAELRAKFRTLETEVEVMRNGGGTTPSKIGGTLPSSSSVADSVSSWSLEDDDRVVDDEEDEDVFNEASPNQAADDNSEIGKVRNEMAEMQRENSKLRQRLLKLTVNYTMVRMQCVGLQQSVRKEREANEAPANVHVQSVVADSIARVDASAYSSGSDSCLNSEVSDTDSCSDSSDCESQLGPTDCPPTMSTSAASSMPSSLTQSALMSATTTTDISDMCTSTFKEEDDISALSIGVPISTTLTRTLSRTSTSASILEIIPLTPKPLTRKPSATMQTKNVAIVQRVTLQCTAAAAATATLDPTTGGATFLSLALCDAFTRDKAVSSHTNLQSITSRPELRAQQRSMLVVVDGILSFFRSLYNS